MTDPGAGSTSTVELGVDWRAHPPVRLSIGPVLHPADAVANTLRGAFGVLSSSAYVLWLPCSVGPRSMTTSTCKVSDDGRFTMHELLRMAADHDPGFDLSMFVAALRAVRRFPISASEPYRLAADQVDALQARLLAWADEVEAAGR